VILNPNSLIEYPINIGCICLQLDSIDRFIFCVFLYTDLDLYESWMQVYFPSTDLTATDLTDASGEQCTVELCWINNSR